MKGTGLEEGSGGGRGKKRGISERWHEEDLGVSEGGGGVERARGEKKGENKIKLRTLLISERESCLKSGCLSALAAAQRVRQGGSRNETRSLRRACRK